MRLVEINWLNAQAAADTTLTGHKEDTPILDTYQIDQKKRSIELLTSPDLCPWCHKHCSPRFVDGRTISKTPKFADEMVQLIFQCPNRDCQNLFIADCYAGGKVEDELGLPLDAFVNLGCWPISIAPDEQKFPETVLKLSPRACKILKQSREAEMHKLDEIAGPGFRKSLEFLIKDYLCHLKPGDAATIKQLPLAGCISQIDDPRLKQSAERAAWLGNDETHYLRVWESHDIVDLKKLLHLVVNWVDSGLTSENYIESMAKKTK